MKMDRRKFMALAGASAAVLGMPNWSFAQSAAFDKLNIFVPAAAGGGWDGLARSIEGFGRVPLLAEQFWNGLQDFGIVTIPMFLLMGIAVDFILFLISSFKS